MAKTKKTITEQPAAINEPKNELTTLQEYFNEVIHIWDPRYTGCAGGDIKQEVENLLRNYRLGTFDQMFNNLDKLKFVIKHVESIKPIYEQYIKTIKK